MCIRDSVVAIGVVLPALHFVERRTGDVDVTTFHQLLLVTVEEGEQQGADVGTVHVGVGHDHDSVVTEVLHIEVLTLDPQAQGGDQRLNLSVLVDLGVVGLLDVEDLAPQRQDRLETTVAALLGGATSGVTLNDVCLLYTSPSPRDRQKSRMPSSA